MSTNDQDGSGNNTFGRYFGRLLLEPLPDGFHRRLAEAFGFLDARKKRWLVPQHAQVDGASIPRVLWTLIGSPFTGKYLPASVVHDYFCAVRLEPWQAVHHVFYEAMRASGVSSVRSKLMYAGVYFAGPRWSDIDTINIKLPRVDDSGQFSEIHHSRFDKDVFEIVGLPNQSVAVMLKRAEFGWDRPGEAQLNMEEMQRLIEEYNPSLAEIENAIDQAVAVLESPVSAESRSHALVALPTE